MAWAHLVSMRRLMRLLSSLLWFVSRRMPARTQAIKAQRQSPVHPVPKVNTLRYRIRFSTHGHERIIHASDEREAALKAEAILRNFYGQLLPVNYRIEAPVGADATRLAKYLDDVTRELEMSV